jgi:hypothetical protein
VAAPVSALGSRSGIVQSPLKPAGRSSAHGGEVQEFTSLLDKSLGQRAGSPHRGDLGSGATAITSSPVVPSSSDAVATTPSPANSSSPHASGPDRAIRR